jgi:hypothetical protein
MNVNLGFLAVTKKYSTCICFIPSEITMELVKTVADHEFCSQFTTTTKLLNLIYTIWRKYALEEINIVLICIFHIVHNKFNTMQELCQSEILI